MSHRSTFAAVFRYGLLMMGWVTAGWLAWRAPVTEPPPSALETVEEDPLGRLFAAWQAQPELAGAAIGFCLLDEDGAPLFASPLAHTALCPASALKTVTSAAALGVLGPEFRFETTLAATAAPDGEGTLAGDLVLVGAGDPTFSTEDLHALADAAGRAGLRQVTGTVRVDASIFPHDPLSDFWNWGDVGNAYGAGAYGLNLDHNRMTITFDPGAAEGAPATLLGSRPILPETRWENYVTTGPAGSGDGVVVYSEPYGRRVTLRGTVPLGERGFAVRGAIPDPPALAAEVLRARLEKAGVKFDRAAVAQDAPAAVVLARHESAPLPEIIDHLHRVSDNLETQCLFLAIGQRRNAAPAAAVRAFWEEAGVAFTALRLLDGSGLARANMIRPLDLARVNHAARRGPHGERFYQSLSTYLDGAVRSKLGAMSGVKTEVGFLRTASGRELTFALMANGLRPGLDFWPLRSALLEAVMDSAD